MLALLGIIAVSVATALPLDGGDRTRPSGGSRPSPPAQEGLWLTAEEIRGLPLSGAGWLNVKREADRALPRAHVSDQTSLHDTSTLAVALVAARTGELDYRRKAADAIIDAIGSEDGPLSAGTRILPVARNTASYVIAADLINLRDFDSARDDRFRAWLEQLRTRVWDGKRTLVEEFENNATNHGTMAGQSVIAMAAYLGDGAALARATRVFRGWLGDRSSDTYDRYPPGAESFMSDPSRPRPVNPAGATTAGHNLDGALPAEWTRCGSFRWPPCYTDYAWGGLSGSMVAAELLYRAGYTDVYEWEDAALLRAYTRLYELSRLERAWWQEATSGDDSWQPWLVNHTYATDFPATSPTRPGKNMGWTDWTHGSQGAPRSRPFSGLDVRAPARLGSPLKPVAPMTAGLADGWFDKGVPLE